MPATDDSTLADLLHMVTPEPPDELLDLTALRTRVRHRRTTRIASLAASTVVVIAGLTTTLLLIGTGSSATSPTRLVSSPSPAASASASPGADGITTVDCRAQVRDGRLVAPFVLDSGDRFDRPNPAIGNLHTATQALAADRASEPARPGKRQAFRATYSMVGVRTTQQVWVVVTYHIIGPPPMGPSTEPPNSPTDEVTGYDAATLHPLLDVFAMPKTCGGTGK